MPQAVWTGSLSFGLVNIPVKIYVGTASKDVRFHQFESGTGRRVRYRRVTSGPPAEAPIERSDENVEPATSSATTSPSEREAVSPDADTGSEVAWQDVVKGYEVEPGRVVTLTPEELLQLAPERSRVLEVEQFVDLDQVDPVYFDKSYYVVPQPDAGAERPYWLLFRAMEASSKVAIGRFVMRTKEYLAAIRPAEHALMLETLFYADEIRDVKEVWRPIIEEPAERELRVARQLIGALEGDWEASRYRDDYRERVLDLLRSKSGEAIAVPEPEEEDVGHRVGTVDLMEALKRSVEATKDKRAGKRRGRGNRAG
jgi:DNA end-binding protein Ku